MFITVTEEAIFLKLYINKQTTNKEKNKTKIGNLKKKISFNLTRYLKNMFIIIYKQTNNQQRKKQNQNWKIQFLLI